MRMLKLTITTLLLSVAVALQASAAPHVIHYELLGGTNTTALLGGEAPTGGSATVRWPMTASGAFSPGAAQILSLKFTHLVFGTLSLTGASGAVDPTIKTGAPFFPLNASFGADNVSGAPTLLSLPATGASHTNDVLAILHNPFSSDPALATFFLIRRPEMGGRRMVVSGVEIARTPEPGSAPLAGLGLLVFGIGAARRRSRRRKSC
jgi:hypothetical protein